MDLRKSTIKGTGWSILSQAFRLTSRIVVVAILARLLTPDDFGLIAMVTVVTNLLLVLNDAGIPSAIIQKPDLSEDQISSSFWLNILIGIAISLVFVALAPLIALFYGEDRLLTIALVLSPMFFIASFGMVQFGLLSKRIDFRPIAISEIAAAAVAGTTAIVLALLGAGVWSLVFQVLAASFILALFLWFKCEWKPSLHFRWSETRGIVSFGLYLTGFQFVNYFNRNLDNLLIGRFLGSELLGFYDIAYKILLFPLQNISAVIGRVMFPALSTIQDDEVRMREAYMNVTRYIAFISFPIVTMIIVLAPEFTRVVLGDQWERSIQIIQTLAVVALVQSIASTVGWLYLSKGKTNILFLWGIITAVVYTAAFVIGLHWSIEGVAAAYAIANVLLLYPAFAIPFRFINLGFLHFIRGLSLVVLATAIMGAAAFGIRYLLADVVVVSDVVTLVAGAAVAVVIYIGLIYWFDRKLVLEIISLFKALREK
ncbi:MAG: MOP flippase family protein [Actinobacteria bacterium]|nr:MOP flippase family protein [Actinomycetota bacterium]